jgi:hypothetical protein
VEKLWDKMRNWSAFDQESELGGIVGSSGVFLRVEIDFDRRDLFPSPLELVMKPVFDVVSILWKKGCD